MILYMLPADFNPETSDYNMGHLVFQVTGSEDGQYQVQYPSPNRGHDAELDFDDGQFPQIMFWAMMGISTPDWEIPVGRYFRMTLPSGVYNG